MRPMTPELGEPASDSPGKQTGWFSRVPLWVRITVPAVLLVGGAAVVALMVSRPQDPIETAQSLCRSAVLEELESFDRSQGDVSRSFDTIKTADGYRAQGTATYEDADGSTHHANVRCIIRVEDGGMRVTSVRIQD